MVDGVLLIDKPAGISSHDVVAAVRRSLGGARTGHAGTLDPFATGLLLVLVGKATKAQGALMALPKRYETVAQLGAVSNTGDTEGEITHTGRVPPDPPELPTGELRQRPPIYSAVKIGGSAHTSARAAASTLRCPADRHRHALRAAMARPRRPAGPEPPGAPPRAGFAIECGLGDLCAFADRRPWRRLLPDAEAYGDRPVRGPRRGRAAGAPPARSCPPGTIRR